MYCIGRQETLGKERELLIADSAPGSVFNSRAGNEKEICVRESKKNRRWKKKKNQKEKQKETKSNWFKAKKQIMQGLTHSQTSKSRRDVAPWQKNIIHYKTVIA